MLGRSMRSMPGEMTMLEVLASVGEFVAVITAIAALIYLGAQIRRSNVTARTSSADSN